MLKENQSLFENKDLYRSDGGWEHKSNRRQKSHRPKSHKSSVNRKRNPATKDLVREDVYLMDRTVGPLDKNLLANSWSARLRRTVPGDYLSRANVMNKLRRESVKNFLQLANLNRQFSTEMQSESNRLDKEGKQLVKRHENLVRRHETLRRHSESQKKKTEAHRQQKMSESGTDIVLPKIAETGQKAIAEKDERVFETAYAEHPGLKIDKDDSTFVKVYKKGGIFKPQSMYLNKQGVYVSSVQNKPSDEKFDLVAYESLHEEKSVKTDTAMRKKKGLRVTWSSMGGAECRSGVRADDTCSTTSGRTEEVSTPSTIKSSRSDSFIFRKPEYRTKLSKVQSIGVRWNLPQEMRMKRMNTTLPGQHSRTTVPMTLGLEREGTSVNKLKWQTQRSNTNLTSTDVYKAWLAKLELLKNPIPPPEKPTRDTTKGVAIQI